MERQLRMGGGIMNVMPREQYGLGSLVKSVTKGVKKAVSGVKDFAKSDLGKAALLYVGGTYLGGTSALGGAGGSFMSRLASPGNLMNLANIPSYLGGKVSGIPGASKVSNFFGGEKTLGKTAAMFAGGSLLGGLASAAESGDEEAVAATRDVNALRSYLEKGYRNLNYSEDEIPALVESDVAEYTSAQGGYANGGRIGFNSGTPKGSIMTLIDGTRVQIPAGAYKDGKFKDIIYSSNKGDLLREEIVRKLEFNEGQRDTLYGLKINPITFFNGVGLVNYGQKTRARNASALDRINVARLVVYLRSQLNKLARPYIFEPNDKITRDEVKQAVESLLLELVGLRALYDFAVVCDETNNTPARVDRNELYVDIAIEPIKAIEFIYIPLRVKNTGEI